MRHFDIGSFPRLAESIRKPYHDGYYAMYSSVYGGIVTDPVLMMIPIDDHMVHRGDGIFEVFKCVAGNIYNMRSHLKRLSRSATMLGHNLPWTSARIGRIVAETIRAGGHKDCYVHLYVSRGPGSFGVNPYDCPATQLYVAISSYKKPFMELHPRGAVVGTSSLSAKQPFYAGVKSCNYLQNALMKKECVDMKVDFAIAFDGRGYLTEGATENMGIVTRDRRLLFPQLEGILCGTTMMRLIELARSLVRSGQLANAGFANITRRDVDAASELLIVGTTPNVTMVREFDGRLINGGKPGPIFRKLNRLLDDDMHINRAMLTPVFK